MSDNAPRKHHFAPIFYLDGWTGSDGRLEQFSRPWGPEVRVHRVFPAATGYAENLYTMPGFEDQHRAQQVETQFMQKVDDLAAIELARMKAGGIPRTRGQRSAWTRFMLSLQLRTPSDIAGIKSRTRDDWGVSIASIQEAYEELKGAEDPPTFEAFMTRGDPDIVERIALRLATRLIDNPKIGETINGMIWDVIDVSASNLDLLTSDQPYHQVLGLADPRAMITLPLTPRLMFVAAHNQRQIANLHKASPRELVRLRNHSTVALARSYVWASDRNQQAFIQKTFGTIDAPTLGERLAGPERSPS